MRKTWLSLLSFGAALLLLVGAMRLLNWLPLAVQKEILRPYKDVEEVKSELKIREIFVPAYFPQNLRWPPSAILAQGTPFPAVIMEFQKTGSRETVLVIAQSAAQGFPPDDKIRLEQVAEKATYSLRGRDTALEVGICANGEPCSKISWKEQGFHIIIAAKSPPLELIRVAESMLR